ncbi:MAG: sigma-70 family RNA polymerase sigma factor [Crocinitomicaceae bacterium]|jgi:RNA polymerase sigma factor (sigma-70 family)|nr:sigma-70 family RNA polymerase sigma factor [Crocinitomicaceae bacterium]
MDRVDDNVLVGGIREGNNQMLNIVYTTHYPMIRKLVLDNSGSEAEAKDVFQEAIIILHENINTKGFNLTCKIKTYIYSVSRNIWLKELKKRLPQTKDLNDHIQFVDINRDFEKHEEKKLRLNKINQALNEIGEPCKSILVYFFFNQLTMEEIAAKMGYTNADNVKNQKYKCFKRLKKLVLK